MSRDVHYWSLLPAYMLNVSCLISNLLIYNTFTMVVTEEKTQRKQQNWLGWEGQPKGSTTHLVEGSPDKVKIQIESDYGERRVYR